MSTSSSRKVRRPVCLCSLAQPLRLVRDGPETTMDAFRTLTGGSRFDRNRFKADIHHFQPQLDPIASTSTAAPATALPSELDFFGATAPQGDAGGAATDKDDRKDKKKQRKRKRTADEAEAATGAGESVKWPGAYWTQLIHLLLPSRRKRAAPSRPCRPPPQAPHQAHRPRLPQPAPFRRNRCSIRTHEPDRKGRRTRAAEARQQLEEDGHEGPDGRADGELGNHARGALSPRLHSHTCALG